MNILTKLSAAALLVSSFTSSAVTLGDLDFSKLQNTNQGLVFVPVKNTTINSGVFWYTELAQTVSPIIKLNPYFNKITLRAFPEAHQNGAYNGFVNTENARDLRQNLLPSDAQVCAPNSALIAKLSELDISYEFTPRVGSYPGLCWLDIKYFTGDQAPREQELLSFLNNNQAIEHYYQIGGSAKPAVYIDTPQIIADLVAEGLLTQQPSKVDHLTNEYTGNFYSVAFASSHLPATYFRSDYTNQSQLTATDWTKFMELVSIDLDGSLSLPESAAATVVEIEPAIPGTALIEVDTRATHTGL